MLTVDLRKDKRRRLYGLRKERCGVICKCCDWRGLRIVAFKVDIAVNTETARRVWLKFTNAIKGVASEQPCPHCVKSHCDSSEVVFTHYPEQPSLSRNKLPVSAVLQDKKYHG